MPLSDAQIERYSRQIVLPEIGGRGQQRLLAATVAIAGCGPLAATAARYLVGAGIGQLRLDAAAFAELGLELQQLNPDVTVMSGDIDSTTTVAVAADLTLTALDDRARRAREFAIPLIAAGGGGWLHVPAPDADCAGCAARTVAAVPCNDAIAALSPVATGVLGSLLGLAAIEHILGLGDKDAPLQRFAAETSLLTPVAWSRAANCRAHAA